MSKPALGTIEAAYRNDLERDVGKQLAAAGVEFDYEGRVLLVDIPARVVKSKLDFPIRNSNIIIETKGHFGGPKGKTEASAAARQKLVLLKQQYPDLDIRLVFQNKNTRIYKGSKTTNAKWAEDHGFLWADKGIVPTSWITEIMEQQRGRKRSADKLAGSRTSARSKNRRRAVGRR